MVENSTRLSAVAQGEKGGGTVGVTMNTAEGIQIDLRPQFRIVDSNDIILSFPGLGAVR